MGREESARRVVLWAVGATAAAFLLLTGAWVTRSALLMIYVSALLAMGMSPFVRLVERHRFFARERRPLPRWLAILLVYVAVLGIVAAVLIGILPTFVEQARQFAAEAPKMFAAAQQWLIDRGLMTRPVSLGEALREAPAKRPDVVQNVVAAMWTVLGGIVGLVTMLFLTFYLLVESRGIFETFVRLFPARQRARAGTLACRIVERTSAWLGGQMILCGVIGGSTALVLGLMGVPYFYVLALISALGELVPVVGPIIAAVPGIGVAFTESPQLALGVAVFYLIQQQLEGNFLTPKVMERQVGVSASAVIIALLVGHALLGLLGAVLAIPTAAIIKVLFDEFRSDEEPARIDRRAA
jgi:predicted PurR-regulated permease PerM